MYPSHVELDPTLAYSAGYCAYISPLSTLATSGMTDLDLTIPVVSPPGVWLAMQDVPPAVTAGYNVPQDPVPGANTEAPTGTPLKGDLDSTSVYWVRIQEFRLC